MEGVLSRNAHEAASAFPRKACTLSQRTWVCPAPEVKPTDVYHDQRHALPRHDWRWCAETVIAVTGVRQTGGAHAGMVLGIEADYA